MTRGEAAPALVWAEAQRGDRFALQQFDCTFRKPSNYREPHSRGYELDVQNRIHDLKPPFGQWTVMLGRTDGGELASVVWWMNLDEVGTYQLVTVAVSMQFRGCLRPTVGDAALAHAIDVMEYEAAQAGAEELEVWCHIHFRNSASLELFARNGFKRMEPADADGIETWLHVRGLSGVPVSMAFDTFIENGAQ